MSVELIGKQRAKPQPRLAYRPPDKQGSPIQRAHHHESITEVTDTLLTFPAHSLSLTQHQGVAVEGTLPQKGTHPAATLRQGHGQAQQGTATSKEIPLEAHPIPSGTAPPQAGIRSKKKLCREYECCGD